MRTLVYSAVVTIFALFGGLLLGVIVGNIIFELTPGHTFQPLDPVQIILPATVALAGFFAGGAMMARMLMKR